MNTDLRALIRDYLQEAKLMQLATAVDGQPWVCNVWFAADENMNIYWFSSVKRRHSKEVTLNEKVAGAMALPHTPEDKPRGLQFQGTTRMLTDEKEIEKAISVYADRIFHRDRIKEFMESETSPHRFFVIRPNQFVLFDVVNFPDNSRQELNLET